MLRLNIGRGSSLRQECEERRKNNINQSVIVIVLIAVVRDVLLLPGCGPHHVHHHRLQQPPGVQPPAGPRTQPLFRGGLVDRSSLIFDLIIQQRDFYCSLLLGLHQYPGLLPGRGPV